MRIRFQRRISGVYKVMWKTEELDVESYEVFPPGTQLPYHMFPLACWAIKPKGHGTFELRPGTLKVLEE